MNCLNKISSGINLFKKSQMVIGFVWYSVSTCFQLFHTLNSNDLNKVLFFSFEIL